MIPWCSLNSRGMIIIQGSERVDFLQGLVTQSISESHAVFSAILTPQGRFFADFFALNTPHALFLECSKKEQASVLGLLQTYSRLHEVSLHDGATQYGVCAAVGKSALQLMQESPFYQDPSCGVMMFPDPRHPDMGMRAWVPYALWNDLPHAYLYPCQESHYHAHRIALGMAESMDLIPQQSIILEYGYNEMGAISWTKGCYMGQELMARTFHRGVVRKHLYRLQRVSGDFPPSGSILYLAQRSGEPISPDTIVDTHRIGYMGSNEGLWGLASLHESVEDSSIPSQESIFLYPQGDSFLRFSVLLDRVHQP